MKQCYTCKDIKPFSEFSKKARNKDGLQHECKQCKSIHQRNWYKDNSTKHKQDVKRIKNNYLSKMREFKDNIPCTDCGVAYPYFVMDFDHLPGTDKLANVSYLYRRGSVKKFTDEIAKCELVCANCHRFRTHIRQQNIPLKLNG